MKSPIILAFATLTALAGCASIDGRTDAMCVPLREFSTSVRPGESKSIIFHTIWGGNFLDEMEPAIFGKRCVHSRYGPAKAVCTYLMEHGAAEFSGNNVERALACLEQGTGFGPNVEINHGEFWIRYGTPDRGAHILVEFEEDTQVGGMVLRITADGY